MLSCLYHGCLVAVRPSGAGNLDRIVGLRSTLARCGSMFPGVEMPTHCRTMYSESRMEHEISPQQLHEKLRELRPDSQPEQFFLLDVRETWEAATASIPGSRLIPMGEIPSRVHQELDPDAHIVAYCHHGMRSLSVVMWLREQGFPQAQSLSGGIDAWAEKIDPSMARY